MLPFTGGPGKARSGSCSEWNGLPNVKTPRPNKSPFLSPSAVGDSIGDPKEDSIEPSGAVQVWGRAQQSGFLQLCIAPA